MKELLDTQYVLLLEADHEFRAVLKDMLTRRGYRVYEAELAEEAARMAERHEPELAIVAYALADIDGVAWITSMREKGKHFPIVFLSDSWCDSSTFNSLKTVLKVPLILQKPIVPELFMDALDSLLGSRGQGAQDMGKSGHNLPQFPSAGASDEAIAKAVEEYAANLPAAVKALEQKIRTYKNKSYAHQLLESALERAHQLADSSGSFGFVQFSEALGNISEILGNLEVTDDTLAEILWTELHRRMAEVAAEARQIAEQYGLAPAPNDVSAKPKVFYIGNWSRLSEIKMVLREDLVDFVTLSELEEALSVLMKERARAVILETNGLPSETILSFTRRARAIDGCEHVDFALVAEDLNAISASVLLYAGVSTVLPKVFPVDVFEKALESLIASGEYFRPRILAVDDDRKVTDFIKTVLVPEEMIVECLNESRHILPKLEQCRPDILVLDVVMPRLSGYDICRMLRGNEKWSDLPIIFLTGKNDEEARSRVRRAGGKEFLDKPVASEELVKKVRNELEHSPFVKKQDLDSSTGLMMQDTFLKLLQTKAAYARLHKQPLTLCLLETKELNPMETREGQEHQARLLRDLAAILKARFRADDIRGRLPTTCALLVLGQPTEIVEPAMRLLQKEFAEKIVAAGSGGAVRASLTFGLSELHKDADDESKLMEIAADRLAETRESSSACP